MKVVKHGNNYTKSPPIPCKCKGCQCEMDVEEWELEGKEKTYVWCPECKELIYVSSQQIETVRINNIQR